MSDVKPIPDGYPVVSPALAIDGAAQAIDFYKRVFGAAERFRMPGPEGTIAHCELLFGDSVVMIGDPAPEMGFRDPKSVGGTPVNLYTYVEDADAAHAAALAAGARELQAPETQFYGDRTAAFEDPWGHRWTVSTHVEEVSPEEMEKRMAQLG
ncbi:VOC family protein [Nocardia otitidiscaviarum]|uniref:VOC family protein n=1 Tax=Nocardia otitidiscaviarum TaxID=1823 RepID=A0A516NIQ1_9NOCA|nr:VOC family protein [Nocardia otitidiscaviarum]MBF6177060.1 VOC family protein [Nocardia otitidiscaviarum]MCP9619809.1 VOC family protein [Nocardia otitidiscaviarum]QDP78783.1 VOC family protein [Nocardia otitidiscaviarum]